MSVRPGLSLGVIAAALAIGLLATAACSDDGGEPDTTGRFSVTTTLELFADMTRNVAGGRADVGALLPSGADPHTFELAPGRVRDIAHADLVIVNGLGLEGNLLDVVSENAEGQVLELSQDLDTIDGNPHLWLDAQLAARYVERIRDALVELDPEGRDEYEANAAAYLEEFGALDGEIEQAVLTIPEDRRKLVTFHDAFPYFASRYGLEVVAVVVPSPGQEPSARDVAELTEKLTAEQVPAVFREPQFSNDVLEQAADDAGVEVLELLSGAFIESVDSYIELMRFNEEQLLEGLGGD